MSVGLHLLARIAATTDAIYTAAHLRPPSTEGAAPESGEARARAFEQTRATLMDAARELSLFDYECAELAGLWAGESRDDVFAGTRITYPSDFDVRDLKTVLEAQLTVLENADKIALPSLLKASRLAVAHAMDPDASDETRTSTDAEAERVFAFEAARHAAQYTVEAAAAEDVADAINAFPLADDTQAPAPSAGSNGVSTMADAGA